jgi:hypothetical protein
MDQQPRRNEKDEKNRGRGEKREKGQPSDSLTGFTWGAILIVAGIIFLLLTLNTVPALTITTAWGIVFLAAGLITLISAVIRVSVPTYRRPITGTLILAFILLAIGVGILIGFENVWPIVIIAIGLIILIGQFTRR